MAVDEKAKAALDRTIRTYVELGRHADAAKAARGGGRNAEASNLYAGAGMYFEAAECAFLGGDAAKALDYLVLVSRDHPRYRQAAVAAARIAGPTGTMTATLDRLLQRFLESPPADPSEVEAFYFAALLYERGNARDVAAAALSKVVARDPQFRDAAARLQALQAASRPSGITDIDRILREDASFRGRRSAPKPIGPPPAKVEAPKPPSLLLEPIGPNRDSTTIPPGEAVRATASAIFSEGATIAGRYLLEARIGEGGMATVFRAKDLEINDLVALKVFTQVVNDEQIIGRIKEELRLSRLLAHPNIIRIYDMGIERGHRYISMELLIGKDLLAKVSEGTPISLSKKLDWLIQGCNALGAAHAKGVVHRDVKPENFFVLEDGTIKLMDFGLAKGERRSGLTQVGMIAGTPEYMAPEQINDFSAVTPATDLYAMGVVAYRIFTGTVPFTHTELMPLLMMQVNEPPPPPRSRKPDLPPEIETVILKLLEKDPANRYASGAEVAKVLSQLRQKYSRSGYAL
jgi:serine/threonine-protein kinase